MFPFKMLSEYASMSTVGAYLRHAYGVEHRTLYGCVPDDIVEIDRILYRFVGNHAYDQIVENLHSGERIAMLPTIACKRLGNLNHNFEEIAPL